MISVNLKYDCRELSWHRRSLFDVDEIREARSGKSRKWRWLGRGMALVCVAAVLMVVVPNVPFVAYRLFPGMTEAVASRLGLTGEVAKSEFGEVMYEETVYVPPMEEELPEGNWLVIEKIGFNSAIGEAEVADVEEVLKLGPWRVGEMGTPELRYAPVVLAAHRFGYLHWTNQYRREHSFFNLPKLANGDRVEIWWQKRRYVYEVYEGYTDEKIRDFGADLILYTCEVLNSPRRVVRVARLVVPEVKVDNNLGFEEMLTYNGLYIRPI